MTTHSSIKIPDFEGYVDNFQQWKFLVETALAQHGKGKFITTRNLTEETADKVTIVHSDYNKILNLLKGSIGFKWNFLVPENKQNCPVDYWQSLESHFAQVGLKSILKSFHEIIGAKEKANTISFMQNLSQLISSIRSFAAIAKQNFETFQIALLAQGLDDSCAEFLNKSYLSNWTLSDAIAKALEYNANNTSDRPDKSEANAFHTQSKPSNPKKGNRNNNRSNSNHQKGNSQSKHCHFCNKDGHTTESCFENPKSDNYKKYPSHWKGKSGSANSAISLSCSEASCAAILDENSSDGFVVDSGCNRNIGNQIDDFKNLQKSNCKSIIVANSTSMEVVGTGTITITTTSSTGERIEVDINDVLFVPNSRSNLLSVDKLIEGGNAVFFDDQPRICSKNGTILLKRSNGLFILESLRSVANLVSSNLNNATLMHYRLGHPSKEVLSKATGISKSLVEECVDCPIGKMKRDHFPSSETTSDSPLLLIHSDVTGPVTDKSFIGNINYFVEFVDHHSGFSWIYPMKRKSEVLDKFIEFQSDAAPYGTVKTIHLDNGGEYTSKAFKEHCKARIIRHETTVPYNPHSTNLRF
eukprot:TRINITY_DN4522_c0_g4_i1.p1 TRINITY_DN4522_c0_g4~~TRINITY_DN4522_c0_g4_i1.p1  ORF type:complete len:584 (+),score=146.21 TRINITY_DN4522_c0_g4_i1:228-1979(+)